MTPFNMKTTMQIWENSHTFKAFCYLSYIHAFQSILVTLIENMATGDHVILHDRVHIPTKKILLELSSQDPLLAKNKLLSKQLEALTETLSKLPTQLHASQPLHGINVKFALTSGK